MQADDGLVCPSLPAGDGRGAPVHARRVEAGSLEGGWSAADGAIVTRSRPEFTVSWRPGHGYRLEMPAAGRYVLDEAGTSIDCEVTRDVAAAGAGLVVQALPLAATLQGLEPFHAAGVVVDGRAALIAGPVGAGKSSLTTWLVLGGASLLADDVVTVTDAGDQLLAHGGSSWLRVRDAERRRLPDPLPDGLRTTTGFDRRLHLDAGEPPDVAPLHALYVLERSAGASVEALTVQGTELLALTYNLSVRTPERLLRQLALCHAIAARVAVRRLRVQPGLEAEALAGHLADDLRALP